MGTGIEIITLFRVMWGTKTTHIEGWICGDDGDGGGGGGRGMPRPYGGGVRINRGMDGNDGVEMIGHHDVSGD